MTLRKLFNRFTTDRSTRDPPGLQEVLTVEQIGPKRSKTPEGFLLCQEVPIARVGIMLYGPGEVPIEVGQDGVAYVTRDASELFRPETLASFVGKPVVDEHPEDEVNPDNWAKLAKGVAFNIRQGSGGDADVILADLLITDAQMILDIEGMKREVSAGYEADYEQTAEGQGTQSNIIGNHIALVEKGRCGPRCAIGDHSHFTSRKATMPQVNRRATATPPQRRRISKATLDALMEQLGGESEPDASTMDDGELSGPADSHTHIHIHGIGTTSGNGAVDVNDEAGGAEGGNANEGGGKYEARFAALENGHKEILAQIAALTAAVSGKGGSGGEDPTGKTGDEEDPDAETKDENPFAKKDEEGEKKDDKDKGKTNDSAALEGSYKETLAGCEVLVPGFRMPTFDGKAKRTATIDAMCNARRKALDAFSATTEGAALVESIAGVKTVDTIGMACPQVAVLFRAAVGAKKLLNNSNATRDASRMGSGPGSGQPTKRAPLSLAELNKLNREHYAKH
jgi:hypothetical protein